MYSFILVGVSAVFGLIGLFFLLKKETLLILFSKNNHKNLSNFSIALIILAIIGIILGLFFATKLVILYYLFFVLLVSGIFGFLIASHMTFK